MLQGVRVVRSVELKTLSATGALVLAFVLANLSGCAAHAEPGWETELETRIVDRAPLFRAAPQILAGMDPVNPGEKISAGDQVLYGICLDVGEQRTIWYLNLRVLDVSPKRFLSFHMMQPFAGRVHPDPERQKEIREASLKAREEFRQGQKLYDHRRTIPVARIQVEAFDATGESLGSAESDATVEMLQAGLRPACAAGYAQREVMRGRVALGADAPMIEVDRNTFEDILKAAEGVTACDGFFSILKGNPVTRKILFEVIALPTLWSMIRNLGVRTGFSVDFFAATPVDSQRFTNASKDLWSAPLVVELNGQPRCSRA